ncbi:MAG: cysteine desulfurase [Syntrophales bacterium]|nr:cysteine desulfurase [Syntrophales bacterium]
MEIIYLDHCATTPVDPEVMGAMMPYFGNHFGNPSRAHTLGRKARAAVEEARGKTAALIGAHPGEIYFTGGGTEADNLAILGLVPYGEATGKRHIVTSVIEHHAVLNTCRHLEAKGFSVTYIPTDEHGSVAPEKVKESLTDETLLVSIMLANNEIGTIQPLAEIAHTARQRGVLIHTDAVQAVGKIPVHVDTLGVDLLSLSGHKFHGPKGTGALYVRQGVPITPIMFGGGQEGGVRMGTENVAGIVGLGKACEIAARDLPWQMDRLGELREQMAEFLRAKIPQLRINGHPFRRLPHVLSVSFAGLKGDILVQELDRKGIAASAGAACTSGDLRLSHVVAALGIPASYGAGTVRFSMGKGNRPDELRTAAEIITEIVTRLREEQA